MNKCQDQADSYSGETDRRSDISGAENGVNQKKCQDDFDQERWFYLAGGE